MSEAGEREPAAEEVDLAPAAGFVEAALQAEFPGLRLDWLTVRCRPRASPPAIQRRLRALSDRYRGASVVAMRTHPIPHAYRSFFRQVGLDPDATRIPAEEAAVARLLHGGFRPVNSVDDACLIALVETGVPVWALDAELVDAGGPGIRTAREGERLGWQDGAPILPRQLVVADAARVHATLFGEIVPGHRPGSASTAAVLFSVGVDGVPAIHVEEALWVALEVVSAAT